MGLIRCVHLEKRKWKNMHNSQHVYSFLEYDFISVGNISPKKNGSSSNFKLKFDNDCYHYQSCIHVIPFKKVSFIYIMVNWFTQNYISFVLFDELKPSLFYNLFILILNFIHFMFSILYSVLHWFGIYFKNLSGI